MQATVRLAHCFSSVNIFQQADFNFSGTVQHFTLQYLTPSLEKFGNELNKRTLHTERSGNGDSQKVYILLLLSAKDPVNDSVDQVGVVLTAVGFHAQATTIKP